jgi:hypothetical protein
LGSFAAFEELQTGVTQAGDSTTLTTLIAKASEAYKSQIGVFVSDAVALQEQVALLSEEDAASAATSSRLISEDIAAAENTYVLWALCDICLLRNRLAREAISWLKVHMYLLLSSFI